MINEKPRQRAERQAANEAAGVSANVLAECPHWDARLASLTESDEVFCVDYDWQLDYGDDTKVVLRRTVWSVAYRSRDRHIVWQGDVVAVARTKVADFVRDLVSCL